MIRKRCIDCKHFEIESEGFHQCLGDGDPIIISDKYCSKYYGRFNRCVYFKKKEEKK